MNVYHWHSPITSNTLSMNRLNRFFSLISISCLILILLSGCEKEELPLSFRDGCEAGTCSYLIEDNAALNVTDDEIVEIIAGEKLVFTYVYEAEEDPQIADDEYTEFIRFEIAADTATTSFSYEDRDLRQINALMHASCFCAPEVAEIREGSINGTKQEDGSWEVAVEISFDYGTNRMARRFEGVFAPE